MKKLLLDTHTLLWAIGKSDELSPNTIEQLQDTKNKVFVSAVSLWEIALKYSLGKLILGALSVENIPVYCMKIGFEMLPLEPLEVLGFHLLPTKKNHKDPFDRMLIYQCIRNKYILVSKDSKMKLYEENGLKCIW
jgi:PIN domain nuclease of toxin-antitoxin system